MLKVALRGLLAHKGRLLATLLAVALGVAFIGGVLVLTDTMNTSFDDLFATAYEGTDAVVRSDETIDTGFGGGEIRGDIDASLLPTVEGVSTVAAAGGDVGGAVQLIDKEGDAIGGSGFGPPTIGGNWQTVDQLNSWQLRSGKAPSTGEIVVDAGTASRQDFKVGDTITVQTKKGAGDYTLSGIAGFGTADSPAGATYVLFTTEQAQELVGLPGKFSAIGVVAKDGVSQAEVVRDIKAAVPEQGVEVLTGTKITEESQSDLKSQLSFFTIILVAFAVISVIVGGFVIYNSFSIVIAQRIREMALLRAIGASRKQVRRSVLVEAVAVGLLGSVVGFLLGLGIAKLAASIMSIEGSLVVAPRSFIVSLVVGLGVTLLVAVVPASRASRVPPVAAMRAVAIDTAGRSLLRFMIGVALMLLGALAAITGARERDLLLVALGVFGLLLVGMLVAGPGLARPISGIVGWPLAKLRGVTGALAKLNAGRNPKRSAVTAYALMIGIGVVSFFLIVNASIRASIDKVLDETFAVDFIVSAGNFGTLGMPPEVQSTLADLPEVQSAVAVRQAPAKVDGKETMVIGTSQDAFSLFGLKLTEGSDALADGQMVLLDDVAKKDNLAVGSTVPAEFLNTGGTTLTVAGIYEERTEGTGLGDYVIGVDQFSQLVPGSTDSTVLVKLADGESVAKTKPILEQAVKPFGTAKVQTMDDYKKVIGGQLDTMLLFIIVMLGLAFLIAIVGIANTIALSVLERTRELGLLRAVGMTRRQLRSTIRSESVIIALFGTGLGLMLGLLGGWSVVAALRDEGFGEFRIPWVSLVTLVLVAGAFGLVAALWPAWRAGRLKVLDAIHSE